MPGLGEQRRRLVGVTPYLSHMRVAGHGLEVRVAAERSYCARESFQIFQGKLLAGECKHLVL